MLKRKPLTVNKGAALKRTRKVKKSGVSKFKQEASIVNHDRRGRSAQDDGASGGGRIVGR